MRRMSKSVPEPSGGIIALQRTPLLPRNSNLPSPEELHDRNICQLFVLCFMTFVHTHLVSKQCQVLRVGETADGNEDVV